MQRPYNDDRVEPHREQNDDSRRRSHTRWRADPRSGRWSMYCLRKGTGKVQPTQRKKDISRLSIGRAVH